MRTLRFTEKDIGRGYLILVNSSHPVKSDVPESRLVSVKSGSVDIRAEQRTARMLSEITTLLACDREIVPVSGYRTQREQRELYRDALREHGDEFTRKYVALPGCSEHQTGLALDLAENNGSIDPIRPEFPYTGVCARCRELSVRYGFIERYPAGRERITGIAHEPWHFRYVGYPHSEVMTREGLTLEEYTEYLRQFRYQDHHLRITSGSYRFEVFHVPVQDTEEEAVVELPQEAPYHVSGNNVDGVVVTLWRTCSA